MQKLIAGRSLGHSVDTEVETLRLLAMQRRKASLRLFLKRNTPAQTDARTSKAGRSSAGEAPAGGHGVQAA